MRIIKKDQKWNLHIEECLQNISIKVSYFSVIKIYVGWLCLWHPVINMRDVDSKRGGVHYMSVFLRQLNPYLRKKIQESKKIRKNSKRFGRWVRLGFGSSTSRLQFRDQPLGHNWSSELKYKNTILVSKNVFWKLIHMFCLHVFEIIINDTVKQTCKT